MKFLYKIHSGYDGFTPDAIPERTLAGGKRLTLGWRKYVDAVSRNDECWVYFHGPHRFQNGVYIKGAISEVNHETREVILSIRQRSVNAPLTDAATSARIAKIVGTVGRQVFVWPETADIGQQCSLAACRNRLCGTCNQWESFTTIDPDHLVAPQGLPVPQERFIPAYWTIPSRCFLWRDQIEPRFAIRQLTHMFSEFKVGEGRYAYPLALGMYRAVTARTDPTFDAIIPIPLSPAKSDAGELHRTLRLAREFGRLSASPVREMLSLDGPISKRAMLAAGWTKADFECRYWTLLRASDAIKGVNRVLLVDDVCTRGSTLKQACRKLLESNNDVELWLATAGQMIVRAAVADVEGCIAQ